MREEEEDGRVIKTAAIVETGRLKRVTITKGVKLKNV